MSHISDEGDLDATIDRVLSETVNGDQLAADERVKAPAVPAPAGIAVVARSVARTARVRDRVSVNPAVPVDLDDDAATVYGQVGEPVGTVASEPASAGVVPIGSSAADFELVREIGRGGMGVIYAAHQSSLAREIAVKRVRAEATGPETERRFMNEALVTAELDHPNIVPVYDLARDEKGQLFVGMKLVRGISWDQFLHPEVSKTPTLRPTKGRQDAAGADTVRRAALVEDSASAAPDRVTAPPTAGLRESLDIFLKVCDAIAFAHSRGIVHRDLKPANVMVGAYGEVLVMDWGIALDISEEPNRVAKTEHKSQATGLGGTPCYMAPEQARADSGAIGPWTDIYQLGAILYEILTGSAPHRGSSLREVLLRASRGEVTPPSTTGGDRYIPAELEKITMRALAPDPRARFANVEALRGAIREYMGHEESLRLLQDADLAVASLAQTGKVPRDERYAVYSRALGRVAEALHLWPGNELALGLRARTAMAWAEEALERGDLDLAWAQLQEVDAKLDDLGRRKAAIQAAINAQRSRLWRGVAAIFVVFLLVVAFREALRPAFQKRAEEKAIVESRKRLVEICADGLKNSRTGDLEELARKRHELLDLKYLEQPRTKPLSAILAWSQATHHWARGEWKELLDVAVCPAALSTRNASGLSARLSQHPAIARTHLAGRLAILPKAKQVLAAAIWQVVGDAVGAGLPGDAIQQACTALEAVERPDAGEHDELPPRWAALRRAAVWGLAHSSAAQHGYASAATAAAQHMLNFRLTEDPLSGNNRPAAGAEQAQESLLCEDDAWVVMDPVTGTVRWRSMAVSGLDPVHQLLPAGNAAFITAGVGQVVALDAQTGRVLHRMFIDGAVTAISPDPLDPRRMLAVVGPDANVATARIVPIAGGVIAAPQFGMTISLVSTPNRNARTIARKLRMAALAELHRPFGEVQGSGPCDEADPLPVRQQVMAGLSTALEDEPDHIGLMHYLLSFKKDETATRRRALAERMVRVPGLSPGQKVYYAMALDTQGFPDLADPLLRAAATDRVRQGANPDLAPSWATNPAAYLRQRGGGLFATNEKRALDLVEKGRWFANYLEGDGSFYRRYALYLQQKGAIEESNRMDCRSREGSEQGGLFLFSPALLFGLDTLMVVFVLMPYVMLGLAFRLWLKARGTSLEDLRAHGIRTWSQRALTFLTQPFDRCRCVFLSYATRPERFALLFCGLIYAGTLVLFATGVSCIGEVAAAPLAYFHGDPGSEGFLRSVEDIRKTSGVCATSERLLSEGWHQRHRAELAREHLEQLARLEPAEACAPNNLGVLEEEAGRIAAARTLYTRAAALGGDAAATARWNMARLEGNAQSMKAAAADMVHRDHLVVEFETARRPAWAHAPYADLQWMAIFHQTAAQRIRSSLLQLLDRTTFLSLSAMSSLSDDGGSLGAVSLVGQLNYLGVLLLTLLATLWLPLPVRPLGVVTGQTPGGTGFLPGWMAGLVGAVRKRSAGLATLAGLVLPGTHDIIVGRILPGMAKLVTLVTMVAVRTTAQGGGILAAIAIPSYNKGFFPSVPDSGSGCDMSPLVGWTTLILCLVYLWEFVEAYRRARPRGRAA